MRLAAWPSLPTALQTSCASSLIVFTISTSSLNVSAIWPSTPVEVVAQLDVEVAALERAQRREDLAVVEPRRSRLAVAVAYGRCRRPFGFDFVAVPRLRCVDGVHASSGLP